MRYLAWRDFVVGIPLRPWRTHAITSIEVALADDMSIGCNYGNRLENFHFADLQGQSFAACNPFGHDVYLLSD